MLCDRHGQRGFVYPAQRETGQAYNIADPEIVLSVRQLAEAIAAAGKTNVVFDLPDEVEKAGYTMGD